LKHWLLTSSRMSPVRHLVWTWSAMRDERATRKFCSQSGFSSLDVFKTPILRSPRGRTLFILGSGTSINEMSQAQFNYIRENQSIGINFWFFHDFVPNVFSFDAGKVEKSDEEHGGQSQRTLATLFNRPEILDARPSILYLRPHALEANYLFPVSPELKSRIWVSGRSNLISRSHSALRKDLRVLLTKLKRRDLPAAILPDNGSSVVRLIFLAIAQGYRKIVLCGVDLDSRPHFWMGEPYASNFRKYTSLFPAPDGRNHGTAEAEGRAAGNRDFISLLAEAMTDADVGKLYCGSPTSKLASTLETFRWPGSEPNKSPTQTI